MKKNCKSCSEPVDVQDLLRCQSQKHRHLGDAFCGTCAKQYGGGFYSPFYCPACAPVSESPLPPIDEQARTPAAKTARKPAKAALKRHERLCRLRKSLGLLQPQMAILLGISSRQYQDWEYEEHSMNQQGKIVCWHIAKRLYLIGVLDEDISSDWPEGVSHDQIFTVMANGIMAGLIQKEIALQMAAASVVKS